MLGPANATWGVPLLLGKQPEAVTPGTILTTEAPSLPTDSTAAPPATCSTACEAQAPGSSRAPTVKVPPGSSVDRLAHVSRPPAAGSAAAHSWLPSALSAATAPPDSSSWELLRGTPASRVVSCSACPSAPSCTRVSWEALHRVAGAGGR